MSTNAPARRRTALVQLLPNPTFTAWGVWLAYDDAHSDKEYRIVVNGDLVLYQWGRRGAGGEWKCDRHGSHEAAVFAARKQWAAKEAKGYWPVSGVVPFAQQEVCQLRSGEQIVTVLSQAVARSANSVLHTQTPLDSSDRLCLLQLPPTSNVAHSVLYAVDALARRQDSATLPVTAGSFQLLPVATAAVQALSACCPVLLDLGALGDTNAVLLAQTALQLAHDLHGADSSREAFALAVELVESLR